MFVVDQSVLCCGVLQVMLYDDEQGDCITPEDVFERLDDDLAVAGAVIWVGISFEQSASTEYFRKVSWMPARQHPVRQTVLLRQPWQQPPCVLRHPQPTAMFQDNRHVCA